IWCTTMQVLKPMEIDRLDIRTRRLVPSGPIPRRGGMALQGCGSAQLTLLMTLLWRDNSQSSTPMSFLPEQTQSTLSDGPARTRYPSCHHAHSRSRSKGYCSLFSIHYSPLIHPNQHSHGVY